tara:strand:- start:409 stop:528 length:120 start_codon:yes stop_codon:yes gene_type:complete
MTILIKGVIDPIAITVKITKTIVFDSQVSILKINNLSNL